MPGFRHSPLDDIARIRQDLRDRYQDAFAVLKELLQNADDAGATVPDGAASQLVLVLARDGLPGASHPLLKTAGLAVLNDGAFTRDDAISITSLGMSNKAGQVGAAGKFGLGLKSIFHWAEAFFYFSPHIFTEPGQNQPSACGLLNPWWSREAGGGRHQDWEDAWSASRGTDIAAFEQLARRVLNGDRWFGIWIPLRRQDHLRDAKGEIKPIEQRFPETDLEALLGQAWQTRLAETLPLLRRLRCVRVCAWDAAGLTELWRAEVADNAHRIRFGLNGMANVAPLSQPLSGVIRSGQDHGQACSFAGLEQTNGLPLLEEMKQCHTWPSQTPIGSDGAEQQVPEKAEPHGAVIFTRHPANGEGSLRVQHAVFLPLGEPEEIPCTGPGRYCLYLHGFFFVDSGRRHIQPFDDLPANITPEQADSEPKVIKLWNRTLLREVVAPLVLPSLDAFVKQEQMAPDEIESLVGALQKSKTLKPLLPWMCRGQRFVCRIQPGGGGWELEIWQAEGGQPRRWIALPKPNFGEHELLNLLPALGSLCCQTTVSFDGRPSLAEAKPERLNDDELAALLEDIPDGSFGQPDHLDYLLKLIPENVTDRQPDSALVKALVRLVNQLLAQPLPQDKELAKKWKEFVNRLPAAALVQLPVKSSDADQAIKQALGSHALPVALTWADWREAKGGGKISWGDLVPVLQVLGALDLRQERTVQQRSEVVARLLEACPDQPPAWPDNIARLPLFAGRTAGAQTTAASRADLQRADDEGRLFTSDDSWAKNLAKAAPDLKPVLVENTVAKVLGLPEVACDEAACDRLLRSAPRQANDFADRKPLFDRLLGQASPTDSEQWKALRCLLHGQLAEWNSGAALFCEPPQTDTFVTLAKLALQTANQPWRLIPHPIAGQLALNDHQRRSLNLRDTSAPVVEALLKEIGPTQVDCAGLTNEDCGTILLQFKDVDALRGLNIHEALDKRRVRIEAHTYVDDGSFKELPEAFNQLVTRICSRTGYERDCFRNQDGSNRLVNRLSWEAVIEIGLDQPQPADWWETILTAIGRLGTLRTELRNRVREVAWLPLATGGTVKPADLLHIAGAEAALDRLPPEVLKGKVPILRLAEMVRQHERFDTFTRTVLAQPKETLEVLASLLRPHPAWSTGLTGDWSAEQVADWVAALGDAPTEALPVAGLVKALHSREEHRGLVPAFLQSIGGQLGEATYAGVLKHLAEKHQQADQDQRQRLDSVFVRYLRVVDAVGADFAKPVLRTEGVTLRSAAGHWRAPAELAWPTHGVVPDDQLCREHADALAGLQGHAAGPGDVPVAAVGDERYDQAFERTADRLREYFTRWTDHVPQEVIGAFLSVLGDGHEGQIRALAGEFLGQNTIDGIRDAIAGAATQPVDGGLQNALAYHRFACIMHQEQMREMASVLGDPVNVRLGGERGTIFLGSGIQAFPRAREWTERWLHLLCFDPAEVDGGTEQLQGLLRASAEQILASVFCQTGINLQPRWQRWGQPAQLHIRIAQNRVVEAAQAFLRQVGAHHAPAIKEVLQAWDAADRRRAEAEENNRPLPSEVQEALSTAKAKLRLLLAQDPEVQDTALAAVRGKMEQYQYDPKSVAFELWQNADDAAVELETLGYANQQVRDLGCVSLVGQQFVGLVHWGRLINEFQGAEGRSFRERGFDQDLEKMVVQSVSDKATGGAASTVTGKFGLGFKSVFLVSDAPEVVSGSLDFVIRGGIYPVRLDTAQRDALVGELKRLAPGDWRRGTIIRLPLRADGKAKLDEVLPLFQRLAPLLVIFSRKLKRLRLLREGEPEREVRWQPQRLTDGIEVGTLEELDPQIPRALVFSGAAGNDRLQLLLGLGPDGFVSLPKDVPTFWVTAPTRATPDYGFAVNGPFEPDVGRVQLALNSKRNEELADELARILAERLKALCQLAQQDWETVRAKLGLASSATRLSFAESLWEVLGRRFDEKCAKSDSSQPAALARHILWQSENVGLRQFYGDCVALPTGLWGEHQVLTKLGDIRFVAAGALDREDVFRIASQWPAFQRKVQPRQAVSESGVACVLRRLGGLPGQTTELYLATVVEWELEQDQELRADPETAKRLGQLVTPEFLKALKEGEPDEREEQEHKALNKLLPKVLFQAADGSWHQPAELVVAGGEGVDGDEKLRAAFAPPEARLHPAYTGPALAFFLACRSRLEADVEAMANWALQAATSDVRAATLQYLLKGRLAEQLGSTLRNRRDDGHWLWQLQTELRAWFEQTIPNAHERQEILAHRLRLFEEQFRQWSQGQQPQPEPQPEPEEVREPWTVRQLWLWWEDQGKPMGDYVPEGEANWPLFGAWNSDWQRLDRAERQPAIQGALRTPSSDAGKAVWYRLFGYACLVSAGRTLTEMRRFWIERLEPADFWTRTSAGEFSEETREIFEQAVTAEFNNLEAGGEQAYFWRRVFYDIRKVHRMVQNDFPAVLLDLVHQGHGEHLRQFLRTGHLPGPEQPRWIGTFGQSADTPLGFIIRELFRLGVITDEAVRPYAFYVCRPVLRALAKIGWVSDWDSSFSGEQWLGKLAEDPQHGPLLRPYFDIPLLHMGIEYRAQRMPQPPL